MTRLKNAWLASGRALRRTFWHKWLLVVLAVAVVAGGGVVAAAYGYDRSQSDVIAKGIRVGKIPVGGLTADEARAKLERVFKPLERPVILHYKRGRVVVTGRKAGVHVNVGQLVKQALARSRGGWFVPRAWRELTGGRIETALEPRIRYSRGVVRRIVERLGQKVERKPVDATLTPTPTSLQLKGGRPGTEVKAALLRWQIGRALVHRYAARSLQVPLRSVEPQVTIATLRTEYPSYITIDRGNFTLRVYSHLRLVKSYPIAVGQVGLETPAGVYHIQDKQVDPAWHVPNSAWAGSLAGQVIPPGPSDPLKARWMGIFNGAGIHGTDETWSIGHAVSHGCVRMYVPDVIDLYDRVSVGTPVYIGN